MIIRNSNGHILFACEGAPPITGLDELNLEDAQLEGADLNGLLIEWTNLRRANVRGFSLYWGGMVEVDLEGADLEAANLRGTWLWRVNFRSCNLRRVDLRNSYSGGRSAVCGCIFEGANLDGAQLENCWFDEQTVWPAGFDPVARGAVFKPGCKQGGLA